MNDPAVIAAVIGIIASVLGAIVGAVVAMHLGAKKAYRDEARQVLVTTLEHVILFRDAVIQNLRHRGELAEIDLTAASRELLAIARRMQAEELERRDAIQLKDAQLTVDAISADMVILGGADKLVDFVGSLRKAGVACLNDHKESRSADEWQRTIIDETGKTVREVQRIWLAIPRWEEFPWLRKAVGLRTIKPADLSTAQDTR